MSMGKGQVMWSQSIAILMAFLVSFFGYVEQVYQGQDLEMRVVAILAFTLLTVLVCFAKIGKIRYIGSFHILLTTMMLYGGLVAAMKGNILVALSPFLRLLLLLLVSLLVYNFLKRDRRTALNVIAAFFIWCAFFVIAQTVYEVLTGGGVFMNNSIRYYGSITSPIGFASLAFTLMCTLGYFWLCKGGKLKFLLVLGLAWVVIMTSTRSISLMAVIVLWLLIAFRLKIGLVCLWLVVTPLLGWLLSVSLLQDAGVWNRVVSTFNEGGVDGSTSFRLFILDSFFGHVEVSDLVFGLGLGYFYIWFQDITGVADVAPHFEWLWILSEFGLPLFLIYLAYGFIFIGFAFYKHQVGHIDKYEFLVVLLFIFIPQFFLQLSNPFYFYQFVIIFGVMSGIAIERSDLVSFNIQGRRNVKKIS